VSNLENFAKYELTRAGLFDKDSDYGGAIGDAVMSLMKSFSEAGHSGFSAAMTISIFNKVAKFQPLTPLIGDDDEWFECGDGIFQNKRCPHVFKQNGEAYDIESGSRVGITFPYTPGDAK
jgi:hypothetical protein